MKIIGRLIAVCVCMAMLNVFPVLGETVVDNRDLLPAYVPDSEVSDIDGTPEWAYDLMLMQMRIETATEEGTLEAAVKVLDHYGGSTASSCCP